MLMVYFSPLSKRKENVNSHCTPPLAPWWHGTESFRNLENILQKIQDSVVGSKSGRNEEQLLRRSAVALGSVRILSAP
jgi:hypothetical protein